MVWCRCSRARSGTARTRRAHQGAEEPGGQGFPRREAEHAVGHGPHGVLDPRRQGVPITGHRLLRRASGRVDDRHEPER